MKVIHTLKQALKQVAIPLTNYPQDPINWLLRSVVQIRSVNLKQLAASFSGTAQIWRDPQ